MSFSLLLKDPFIMHSRRRTMFWVVDEVCAALD
jgi:hypothetical protein